MLRFPVSRLSRSVSLQPAAPRATPPAGAGPERVKTWNPENLKTCRAPQPRRFPGFQISRFPLPRPVPPRGPCPSPLLRGCRRSRRRWRAGRRHGGGHAPTPSAPQAHTPGHRRREARGTGRSPSAAPCRRSDAQWSQPPRGSPHATRCASSMRVKASKASSFMRTSPGRARSPAVKSLRTNAGADSRNSRNRRFGDTGHRFAGVIFGDCDDSHVVVADASRGSELAFAFIVQRFVCAATRPETPTPTGKFRHQPAPFPAGNRRCHWQNPRKVRHRPLSLLGTVSAVTRDVPKLLALAEERVARTEVLLQRATCTYR